MDFIVLIKYHFLHFQEYEDGPLPDDSLDPGYHYNHRQDDGDSLEGDDYPRHGR